MDAKDFTSEIVTNAWNDMFDELCIHRSSKSSFSSTNHLDIPLLYGEARTTLSMFYSGRSTLASHVARDDRSEISARGNFSWRVSIFVFKIHKGTLSGIFLLHYLCGVFIQKLLEVIVTSEAIREGDTHVL